MFKVFYNSEEYCRKDTLVDAIELALAIHKFSNVKHCIEVYDVDADDTTLTLECV